MNLPRMNCNRKTRLSRSHMKPSNPSEKPTSLEAYLPSFLEATGGRTGPSREELRARCRAIRAAKRDHKTPAPGGSNLPKAEFQAHIAKLLAENDMDIQKVCKKLGVKDGMVPFLVSAIEDVQSGRRSVEDATGILKGLL